MNLQALQAKLRRYAQTGDTGRIPLKLYRPTPTPLEFERAIEAVISRGIAAVAWCIHRGELYAEGPGSNWPQRCLDYAAAIDYLRNENQPRQVRR